MQRCAGTARKAEHQRPLIENDFNFAREKVPAGAEFNARLAVIAEASGIFNFQRLPVEFKVGPETIQETILRTGRMNPSSVGNELFFVFAAGGKFPIALQLQAPAQRVGHRAGHQNPSRAHERIVGIRNGTRLRFGPRRGGRRQSNHRMRGGRGEFGGKDAGVANLHWVLGKAEMRRIRIPCLMDAGAPVAGRGEVHAAIRRATGGDEAGHSIGHGLKGRAAVVIHLHAEQIFTGAQARGEIVRVVFGMRRDETTRAIRDELAIDEQPIAGVGKKMERGLRGGAANEAPLKTHELIAPRRQIFRPRKFRGGKYRVIANFVERSGNHVFIQL